jgi:hypothetical protein
MELTFLELTGNETTSVVTIKDRQAAAKIERETKLRRQFDRARSETLTFSELADKLNQERVRMPDGRLWSAASAARYLLAR